ncbi:8-amino-7-oxononanoate synthase [Brevibacillus sp. SAFN-007a]|uniref:8-amino-7-oxononanoate synthase n=1 Tax=Brevibacillus sp. SAFN-007a TaxID=3436862 RepID=UPI003F7D8720
MKRKYEWLEAEWSRMREQSLDRTWQTVEPIAEAGGAWIRVGGKKLLNLSANNYLGLAHEERIVEAGEKAARKWGAGGTASRLVLGNYPLYDELEQRLAEWKQREGALVFASGYQANTGVIAALAGRGDVVLSDRLNHASIVDGIILSRAEHVRYRHNDVEHLAFLLQKHQGARRKWIVTDSIFSMDGDKAPLLALAELRERYDALLMVDEAHAGGVRGEQGQGLCHELGIADQVDVLMGTFSKAFGAYGAYVCADTPVIRHLRSKARSLLYSTALPPAVVGSTLAALTQIETDTWRRQALRQNASWFRRQLRASGFAVPDDDTHIIPLAIGENERALQFSRKLLERGIAAVAIRPPTVPDGTARIRFTVMATHTPEELTWAVRELAAIRDELDGRDAL